MSEWIVTATEHQNVARQSSVGESVEVETDADGITVEASSGSGHSAQSARAHIPMHVVIAMMRHAGFTVVPP